MCLVRAVFAGIIMLLVAPSTLWGQIEKADLIVYGGTASGVMTAYAAAHEGLRVVLLEPGHHIGGMVTGGLSATDIGWDPRVIGGYPRDFYQKAAAHYGRRSLDKSEDWFAEPHISEEIFSRMLREAGVRVIFGARLREHGGVLKQGTTLVAIVTENGISWRAPVFVDCSYEGDLMAESGVRYVWGRESASQYGESLAGVRDQTPAHQFTFRISAYDSTHRLMPEVSSQPLQKPGTGDEKVQAYNIRVILTDDPKNRLPFPKPKGYRPESFSLLARYLSEFKAHEERPPRFGDVTNPVNIPEHKADFNNQGPFSTDFIGHSWRYPEASYTERARLKNEHLTYVQSFFYFLSHDPRVPKSLQAEVNRWGLPRDEFVDSGHWSNQLYIREGRRMLGEYVMRQSDLQSDRTKLDSVGMGSYNSDSHNVQRVVLADGSVQNEGDTEVKVDPYEIPYRLMLPRRAEATNLLVPVCFSASHVAYSSVRMEPQYMILGQAAGTAAALAARGHTAVQDVPINILQQKLRKHGTVLQLPEQSASESAEVKEK